jgi:hypothetical protein
MIIGLTWQWPETLILNFESLQQFMWNLEERHHISKSLYGTFISRKAPTEEVHEPLKWKPAFIMLGSIVTV